MTKYAIKMGAGWWNGTRNRSGGMNFAQKKTAVYLEDKKMAEIMAHCSPFLKVVEIVEIKGR